ncbi:YigZ family protein [Lentibacillus sp. N15]|uniref:YigZ family protein n=1 Tax=Lentibacillus songyuanensis TaxID=3136161 RepID=UPI0031BAB082
MLSSYCTVKNEGSDQQTIQKSRFIGHIKRVETEDAAQHFIQDIKKKHPDATHNCSAYLIGEHDQIQKANDDGEPSGTAGVPILDVLKKQHLKDTVVVITRYFGGIKLGAGGLIRAYSSTTSQVIQAVGVVERQLTQGYSVTIDYTMLGKVENELHHSPYYLSTIHYLEKAELILYVKIDEVTQFQEWIINLTNGQAIIHETDSRYLETGL